MYNVEKENIAKKEKKRHKLYKVIKFGYLKKN